MDRIASYIAENGLKLFVLDMSGQAVPRRVSTESLQAAFPESQRLRGDGPAEFYVATTQPHLAPMALRSAAEKARIGEDGVVLLLVAYNDGGMISEASHALSFQEAAHRWADWQPPDPTTSAWAARWTRWLNAFLQRHPT